MAGEPAEPRKARSQGEVPDDGAIARLIDSVSSEIIVCNAVRFSTPSAKSTYLYSLASSNLLSLSETIALGLHWRWLGFAEQKHVSLALKSEEVLNGRWPVERVKDLLRRRAAGEITAAQYRTAWELEARSIRALALPDAKAISKLATMVEAQTTQQLLDSRQKLRAIVRQAATESAASLQSLLRVQELVAASDDAAPLRKAREELKALLRRAAGTEDK